jgi:CoA:oxalate CoA-transferase
MAKTGMPEDPPLAAGIAVADHSGALSLAAGVLGALFARERTGKGQRVDASIFGTLIAMQGFELDFVSMSGRDTLRAGRGHQFLHGVWGAYRTSDGWVCIAGVDDKRWPDFCRVMGIEHLQNDPQFDNPTRNFHGWKMIEVLDAIFPKKTTREWLGELTAVDILITEVADYRMLLNNEQARVNGYLQELDHPIAGRVLVSGTPITYNGEVRTESPPAPEMGQHTEEVLLEFGYSWEEISALRDEGAI